MEPSFTISTEFSTVFPRGQIPAQSQQLRHWDEAQGHYLVSMLSTDIYQREAFSERGLLLSQQSEGLLLSQQSDYCAKYVQSS